MKPQRATYLAAAIRNICNRWPSYVFIKAKPAALAGPLPPGTYTGVTVDKVWLDEAGKPNFTLDVTKARPATDDLTEALRDKQAYLQSLDQKAAP